MGKNNTKLVVNYELLDEFCKINNFIIVTDEMLNENNMYKDIVYATDNNFVGKNVYPKDMPILINDIVWKKLININNELKTKGLCVKIYDAYRPIEVQRVFWEDFYNTHGYYDEKLVANPNKYGTHNIIINAIDIMMVKLDGSKIEFPCEFDDFTGKSSIYYDECSKTAKENRDLLISVAKKYGMLVSKDEWWHFYDERLEKYGMKFNFVESDLIPKNEKNVFILRKNED